MNITPDHIVASISIIAFFGQHSGHAFDTPVSFLLINCALLTGTKAFIWTLVRH